MIIHAMLLSCQLLCKKDYNILSTFRREKSVSIFIDKPFKNDCDISTCARYCFISAIGSGFQLTYMSTCTGVPTCGMFPGSVAAEPGDGPTRTLPAGVATSRVQVLCVRADHCRVPVRRVLRDDRVLADTGTTGTEIWRA